MADENKSEFEIASEAVEMTDPASGATNPPMQDTPNSDKNRDREDPNISADANSSDPTDKTRSVIAFRFIIGFFGVVFLIFVTGWSGIFKESDFKDMLLTITGTLSSSLGFIIGYYFKSFEGKKGS